MKATGDILFLLFVYLPGCIYAQTNGDLRLFNNDVTSGDYSQGRLQAFINGQWGNICDDDFDIIAANTACHQLGYESATGFGTHNNDSFGVDDRPALLSLSCSSNDFLHIFQCDYSMSVSCNASNEISVFCSDTRIWDDTYYEQVRLQDGNYPSQGRVEVYTTQWRTLCDDAFGDEEADTVCRQLGYTGASSRNHLDLDSSRSQTSDYGCCYRSQDCIRDCICEDDNDDDFDNNNNNNFDDDDDFKKKRFFFCFNSDDATVQCEFDTSDASNAGRLNDCDYTEQRKIAAIVGGTIGGVIFLIILIVFIVLGVCFFCKR